MKLLANLFSRSVAVPRGVPASPFALASDLLNPLRGLSVREAEEIADSSRNGDFAWIHRIYREIERADATLKVCVARRKGAMSAFDLRAVSGEVAKEQETLAAEQEDALRKFVLGAENISAAMEHLELAAFRGYSHIAPIRAPDGAITEFDLLDSWNISRRGSKGPWLWNPESRSGVEGLPEIPVGETVWVEDEAIDYPALFYYIAKALGIRDWGRFVERFGIPPMTIIMPQLATEADQQKYLNAANAGRQGNTTVWPNGTVHSWAAEARGIEPFSKIIQFFMEQVVLMATGGTLTSLTASGSGTLAGGAHEETWRQVTARTRRINAEALFVWAGKPMLQRKFPGRPILARIAYDDEPKPSAAEILDHAIKAKAAGFEFDTDEINRLTGYKLAKAPDIGAQAIQNARNAAGNARENATRVKNASTPTPEDKNAPDAVLGDLADEAAAAIETAMLESMAKAFNLKDGHVEKT